MLGQGRIDNVLADEILPSHLGGGAKEFVVDKVQDVCRRNDARLGEVVPGICLENRDGWKGNESTKHETLCKVRSYLDSFLNKYS